MPLQWEALAPGLRVVRTGEFSAWGSLDCTPAMPSDSPLGLFWALNEELFRWSSSWGVWPQNQGWGTGVHRAWVDSCWGPTSLPGSLVAPWGQSCVSFFLKVPDLVQNLVQWRYSINSWSFEWMSPHCTFRFPAPDPSVVGRLWWSNQSAGSVSDCELLAK